MNEITLVIPAFNPPPEIETVIQNLQKTFPYPIIVVNDGSSSQFDTMFNEIRNHPQVTILKHAVNLGKGAALKTAFNYVLCHYPNCLGTITIDADGQHHLADIQQVVKTFLQQPNALTLGSRSFNQPNVPLKNKFGNIMIRQLFYLLYRKPLQDTQTGLRAIPCSFLSKLLKQPLNGYEFELRMLTNAILNGVDIREVTIKTIYLNNNDSSHFKPIIDSFRIIKSLLSST